MLPTNRKKISAAYVRMNAAARRFTKKTRMLISDLLNFLITAADCAAALFFRVKLATLAAEITDMLAKRLIYSLMVAAPHSQHIEYSFTSGAL